MPHSTAFCVYYVVSTKPPVYLMDFAVYEPPESWQTSRADLIEIMRRLNCFTPESISFMAKLLDKSGTGDYTHWPPGTTRILRDTTLSPDRSLAAARLVAETVLCSCFEQVLARTGACGGGGGQGGCLWSNGTLASARHAMLTLAPSPLLHRRQSQGRRLCGR